MLESLYIKNFAIVEEQTVTFTQGLNVLSGETGAGKSILIDALGLQLGDRADNSWIRQGSKRCDIQATFSLPKDSPIFHWLKTTEYDEEDNCQLRRTLSETSQSKSYINGIPTTLNQTKQLGEMLVNIHGQHAHQSLTDPEKQLDLLDSYANHTQLLKTTRQAHQQLQLLYRQQRQLTDDDALLTDKRELLTYQQQEIEALEVAVGEFETLSATQKQLASANDRLQQVQLINQALTGDEHHNLYRGINQVIQSANQLYQMDDKAQEINELLNQSLIYLDEAESALNHYAQTIELDPQALAETEQRMSDLHDMARKHQITPEALPALQQSLNDQLETLNSTLAKLNTIGQEITAAEKHYYATAKQLSNSRQAAAKRLCLTVHEKLALLNLENARFRVAFQAKKTPKSKGIDQIVFMLSPNPGQGEKPLHKIASGGELSRISLAIQVASVANQSDATLIFDEVDSGIGGATAEVVGRLLKTLSQYNQVICVTHLAQVAAFADRHLLISKQVKSNKTYTQFTPLDDSARLDELARMSGGISLDKKTQEHAQNMRKNALQFSLSLTTDR